MAIELFSSFIPHGSKAVNSLGLGDKPIFPKKNIPFLKWCRKKQQQKPIFCY